MSFTSSSPSSRSSLVFVALAAGSILIACSGTSTSSSGDAGPDGSGAPKLGGSAKATTCKNTNLSHPKTAADEACDACDGAKCASEGNVTLGSDPDVIGGACGPFLQCQCDCAAGDSACNAACTPPTEACKTALAAAVDCEKAKCGTECSKDGG